MTDSIHRRSLLAGLTGAMVSPIAGCQFPSGLGNLELTVVNFSESRTTVAIRIRDANTDELLFEDETEYAGNDPDADGIPTYEFGVVSTTELERVVRLEATSPDATLDVEESFRLDCVPEHPTYLEIRDGTNGRDLGISASSCPGNAPPL